MYFQSLVSAYSYTIKVWLLLSPLSDRGMKVKMSEKNVASYNFKIDQLCLFHTCLSIYYMAMYILYNTTLQA